MDGIIEMACFLLKHIDLSIKNSLRLVECTLAPFLAFSGPVIIWPEKEFKQLTAAFVRCNKQAWHMSLNTSTALFIFPRDTGGLQIKLHILYPAVWGHLTRRCHFDDGTRQLAEITYQEALTGKTRMSGQGGPPIRSGIFDMGPSESKLHATSRARWESK